MHGLLCTSLKRSWHAAASRFGALHGVHIKVDIQRPSNVGAVEALMNIMSTVTDDRAAVMRSASRGHDENGTFEFSLGSVEYYHT